VRDVKLPDPVKYLGRGDKHPLLEHRATIDQRRGIPGHEDEDLRGIAETERLHREMAQHVARDVIDEDQKEGYATEKIEPNVPRRRGGPGRYLAALASDKEPDKLLRQFVR
jgi:hypothetical protein